MLHNTNIQMLQKHSKVATFEGSFESNAFIYALVFTIICRQYQNLPLISIIVTLNIMINNIVILLLDALNNKHTYNTRTSATKLLADTVSDPQWTWICF